VTGAAHPGRREADPLPEYLTIKEAAEQLRCSTKTVRRYVANGQLLGYRVGPIMVRIRAADLQAMVAAGAMRNARTG
jgi:excisionase family DNA binding protein